MVNILYPNFLDDPEQYGLSEHFWEDLWEQIDRFDRTRFEWSHPWLGTGSPDIKDGNPIFSARSPLLRRGLRIIQVEPMGSELDIQAWLDTFGGDVSDPDSIRELVISCVLSDGASKIAFTLISRWVRGQPISLEPTKAGLLLPSDSE